MAADKQPQIGMGAKRHRAGLRFRVILLLVASTTLPICSAGVCSTGPYGDESRHAFEFSAGYSPFSTTLIGKATDRRLFAVGFAYSYRCWAWKPLSISFTPSIMPVAVVLQPVSRVTVIVLNKAFARDETNLSGAAREVYGFGIAPVGFTVEFLRRRQVYPFIRVGVGILVSAEPVPENLPEATGLNFSLDCGAGVRWHPRGGRYGFELGYKLLHISNLSTALVNPGLDNNVFYAGFLILR
jgi:hypothetical protein